MYHDARVQPTGPTRPRVVIPEQTGPDAPPRPTSAMAGKLVVAALFVAVIGAFVAFDAGQYLSLETIKTNRDRLLIYTQTHYTFAVLIFISVYCLQTLFSLPGAAMLTLTAGFLFGSLAGTLYVNVGATMGATLAFLAARYLLHDWVEAKFGRRLEPLQEGVARNGFNYLLTLRLIPLFPFFLINLLAGLTRIPLATYVAATAIGIIPASFVYAYAGRQLGTINTLGEIASPPVLLAFTLLGLLAIAPILYRTITRKRSAHD